jgi:hypothetical protein
MKNLKLIYSFLLALIMIFTASRRAASEKKNDRLPIILFSDFGRRDYRVPQVKGIIYNLDIDAKVIDGTHHASGIR